MRRVLILAMALVLSLGVRAEFVRPDVAARYAQGVLGMKQAPVQQGSAQRAASRDAQSAPQYYVFNNPEGGWVIIAADDRVNPVIGYSDEGAFIQDNMPENLKQWMDGVAATIDAVRRDGEGVKSRPEWAATHRSAPDARKVELKTALWDQAPPFNSLCPIVTGENVRSVTGCVATSMAIIMRYNRWPARGNGVIGGYTTTTAQTYIAAYSIDDHEYIWDYMPMNNSVGAGWSAEQKYQVAQLMHDCGVAVKMDYTSEASSAQSSDMIKALQNFMSYSESSALISRASYNLDEWYSIMKREIDAGRVVYYAGEGESSAHAFVCDGYDTDGSKLHINWGWGGNSNGFYTLDLTIPDYDLSFSEYQEAIIGIAPDTAVVELDDVASLIFHEHEGHYGISPVTPVDMVSGSEIKFLVGWVSNYSTRDMNAEFRVRLEDKDGKVRQDGWNLSLKIPGLDGYMYNEYTAVGRLMVNPNLTDRFRLYMKDDAGKWVPVRGNHDILPDVDGVMCGVTQDPLIIVPDDCAAGQEIELTLTMGFQPLKTVRWSVNGDLLNDNKVVLKPGDNVIRAQVEYLDQSTGYICRTLTVE